ncbi:MAG: DUF2786 domain-containing protein [Acetobacter papayae]
MSKKAIMERLKKLMALSRSSNVHEAAAALERATQLMREHQITEDDLVLSNVTECNTSFVWGAKVNPAQYQTWLWAMIQQVFGVECVFTPYSGHMTFYGLSCRAEMAAYTCDVLSRQLSRARADFLKSQNKRLKRQTKISRADNFAEGWIVAVRSKAQSMMISKEEKALMLTYAQRTWGQTETIGGRPAREARGTSEAFGSGYREGKNANLHRPMSTQERLAIEGRAA